jgi:cysteate synthase
MPSTHALQTEAFSGRDAATHYVLECRTCGAQFEDDGLQLECPNSHESSLLITNYVETRLVVDTQEAGVFRYRSWLPKRKSVSGSGRTVTYKSDTLTRLTGAAEVWVAFHGYWPERGANLETGTFKDLEACTTLSRLPADQESVLVIASAGNTAAAFARSCSVNAQRCVIVIPEAALPSLRFAGRRSKHVRIVSLASPADYTDAIELSNRLVKLPQFRREGGVSNVARRDGLGTLLLNAAETIGRLPDCYFQAVGSGSGAIAVQEAALRLVADGHYGQNLPRHILSQNLPFAPMYSRWKARERSWVTLDEKESRQKIAEMAASVLSNRKPPYSLPGGVFDVLRATNGDMMAIDNAEAREAGHLFEELEGVDIEPASAVAVASLLKAASKGRIGRSAVVLINITGGGRKGHEGMMHPQDLRPDLTVNPSKVCSEALLERVSGMFF